MYPVLLKLGPVTIHTYGALLALGALLGILLVGRLAKKSGLDPEQIQNLLVWCLLAGLVGSRLAFVFIEWGRFAAEPWRMFQIWDGGLVFYGGILGGLPTGVLLARRWGIPLLPLLDCAAPGLALAQFFGRLGCFSAGCCYGKPYDGACAVLFSSPESLAPRNVFTCIQPSFLSPESLLAHPGPFALALAPEALCGPDIFRVWVFAWHLAGSSSNSSVGDFRGELILSWLTPTGLFALCLSLVCGLALAVKWYKSRA